MSLFGGNNVSRLAVRFVIVFAIIAVTFTVMGLVDVSKDAFGSHKNFDDMSISDFRVGDIVHGNITETLGCAATMETTTTTMHVIETGKYTSAYYYVVPYFSTEATPDKIIMYRTGNKEQADTLENLLYETIDWYTGEATGTKSHLLVDRAEVTEMSSEEYGALRDYLNEFLDMYYARESKKNLESIKTAYLNAIVPYVVQYNTGGGSVLLPIGLVMIGIMIIGVVIYIAKRRGSSTELETGYTYVGANPMNDPNLNSPTGLTNASDNPYFRQNSGNPAGAPRQNTGYMSQRQTGVSQTNPMLPRQPGSFRTDYSNSERPMPPIEKSPLPDKFANREMNFDPFTGKPIEKKTLVDSVFGGQGMNAQPMRKSPLSRPAAPIKPPVGDSMPSVDPGSEENVDLSNGGISPEDKAIRNAAMPKNGDIPVINPDSHSSAAMFGTIIPVEPTENAPAPQKHEEHIEVTDVTPIHPPTREDNISAEFQVEQTDPSLRNLFYNASGGDMNTVDPYTEKNVDLSNGGVELPEQENDAEVTRRSFPSAKPEAANIAADTLRTDFPEPEPAPEIKPEEPKQPEQPESYNIFKTDSSYSTYKSDYTGGSSYNIFKNNNSDSDDNSAPADSNSDMGFPVENKEFPKLDTSFPTPGESDVGGKDDFIF